MAIFNKSKNKEKIEKATAPEEMESPQELKHMEEPSSSYVPVVKEAPQTAPVPTPKELGYREVPVCLSQAQINNLVIENNIMLKQIIAEI